VLGSSMAVVRWVGGCSTSPPSGVKDPILKDTEVRRGKKGSVSDTLTSVEDFSSDF
jgi:hypothetical protein